MKPVKLGMLSALAFAALSTGCLIVSEHQETGECYDDCYEYQVCETYCDYWECWDNCWYETSCTTYCPDTVAPAPSVECYSALDCGEGQICVADYCRPLDTDETGVSGLCQSCETNADCGEPGALCLQLNFDQATSTGERVCGRACEYNHECPAGFECINISQEAGTAAQCLPVLTEFEKRTCNPSPELQCVRATDCAVGESCVNNVCKAPTSAQAECDSNNPCPSAEDCRNFQCVPANQPECATRTECNSGELCIDGDCVASAETCVFNAECDGGRCVDGQCRSTCAADSECTSNERCRAGLCEPLECRRSADCGAGEICVEAKCHDTCNPSNGVGCETGYLCNANGYCDVDTNVECRSNAECGDEICESGACITPCTCNQDCSTGEVCNLNSGACEAAGAPITACEDSCDCPSGQACNAGTCG